MTLSVGIVQAAPSALRPRLQQQQQQQWRLHRLLVCLSVALVVLSVTAPAPVAASPLEGSFVATPSDADSIQAGAPRTLAQCSDVDIGADSASFYARVSALELAAEPGGLFAVSPTHPLCLGISSAWTKQPGDALLRRCHSAWFSISAIAADADADTPAGLLVTIQYADGGYCSTRLNKKENESSAASADWKAWLYSMIGVLISSVVSVLGILMLVGKRERIQAHKEELLALSCGTFIGSIIFSLLPETALEIGLDVKVSAVILGGILFGMMSEGLIHGGLHYLASRVAGEKKTHSKGEGKSEGVEMTTESPSASTSPQPPEHTAVLAPAASRGSLVKSPDGAVVVAVRSMEACPAPNECGHDDSSDVEVQQMPLPGDSDAAAAAAPAHLLRSNSGHAHDGDRDVVRCTEHPELDGLPSDVTIAHSHAHLTIEDAHHTDDKKRAPDHPHGHGHSHSHGVMDPKQAALLNCLADALHNFIDGALIGAVFLASTSAGWTTVITITLHELPQEISDFTLLIAAGLTPCRAALVNLLVSLTAFLGAIIALAVGGEFSIEVLHVMPFSVGLFLYLSLAVLMPEIMAAANTPKRALRIWLSFAVGIAVMAALLALPWGHTHGGGEGDDGGSHAGHNH